MSTWNTRGLRGSTLETMINVSIEMYREKHLALIQKIPTPIKPINMDKENRQITLAYFDQKSTVDYIGLVQGVPVCFDAKECAVDTIPLHNIHEHQYQFMKDFEEQGGISFIILLMTHKDEAFYIPYKDIDRFIRRREEGGRKSFRFEEIRTSFRVREHGALLVPYLDALQLDLDERDEQ